MGSRPSERAKDGRFAVRFLNQIPSNKNLDWSGGRDESHISGFGRTSAESNLGASSEFCESSARRAAVGGVRETGGFGAACDGVDEGWNDGGGDGHGEFTGGNHLGRRRQYDAYDTDGSSAIDRL